MPTASEGHRTISAVPDRPQYGWTLDSMSRPARMGMARCKARIGRVGTSGCQRVCQRSFRAFGSLPTSPVELLVSNRRSSNEPGLDAFADSDDSSACDPTMDGADSGPLWAGQNDINGLKKGSKLKNASDDAYTDVATSFGQGCKLRRSGGLSTTREETTSGYR